MDAITLRMPIALGDATARVEIGGAVDGVPRHVSAEGCQFALTTKAPDAGARMSFALPPHPVVTGTISWVLGDRIGFGFDRTLCPAATGELSRSSAAAKVIRLVPSSDATALD